MTGDLDVGGDHNVGGDLGVAGSLDVTTLTASSTAQIAGTLTTTAAAVVGTDLSVGGALTASSTAQIAGTLTTTHDAVVGTELSVGTTLTVSGAAQVTGTLTTTAGAVIGTDLSVGGEISMTDSALPLTGTMLSNFLRALTCTPAQGDLYVAGYLETSMGVQGSLLQCCYKVLEANGYTAGCSWSMNTGQCYAEQAASAAAPFYTESPYVNCGYASAL